MITNPESVYGAVLLGPVGELEFIQESNVVAGTPSALPGGLAEVSIEIEPGRAPAVLSPGEVVSVLGTWTSQDVATTRLVADRVVVLSFDTGDADFSSTGSVLRLGIADGAIASDIVMASLTGEVSIIGVTGASAVVLPETVTQ